MLKDKDLNDNQQVKKKRSKIIIDLINEEINVVQAMQTLNLLLQDNNDIKIKEWLNNELNGYLKGKEVPNYRNIETNFIGDYIAGRLQGTNQPLPISPEYVKEYRAITVTSGIDEITQLSIAEKESKSHSLTMPFHAVLANQITMIDGEILSARRQLSIYAYTNILNKIKTKLLNIFIELEKKYGNLDDYYIDFVDKKKEKELNKTIVQIIYDNSVSIGNDNKIGKSKIGVGNEN